MDLEATASQARQKIDEARTSEHAEFNRQEQEALEPLLNPFAPLGYSVKWTAVEKGRTEIRAAARHCRHSKADQRRRELGQIGLVTETAAAPLLSARPTPPAPVHCTLSGFCCGSELLA